MHEQVPVVAVVALGGTLGACARYAVQLAWPTPGGAFPWATFAVNVSGCALMGALMVAVTELWVGHRLIRPFLGTGVLGGYTTFSTFVGDVDSLASSHRLISAAVLMIGTPLAVLITTWTTAIIMRQLIRRTS